MEEQTEQSNDATGLSVPQQETTFEEEETSPPQGTSADPLTQIADALNKLLVARSPREIDVSPYDGTFEAQSFFDNNFDAQADRAKLTYTDRLRKLPCYLQGKPLQYFRNLRLDRLFYIDVRQTLIDLFPTATEASFSRFLAIKLTPQMPLEDYYKNKTVMGMKLNLPADILIDSLTEGLPVADQRLIATVQPNTIKEWFDLVSRIRRTQCATSAVYQRQVDKAPHPTYHNPPPRHNNQRSSRVTYQVAPPPSPCKYCNAMHWHSQCEQRFQRDRTSQVYSARPRTTTVPKSGTRPKVQSRSPVPQVQAASRDDSTSPASSSTTRNLDTISAIKPPTNQKTLQSFLGAVNVYNKFIPDYARLRAPLNKLLKKDVKWNWDPDCQQAFTTLKESLTSKPVLHLYQVGLPCRLYCDASTQGIAGILKQVHPDGQVHPVQYFSRALRAHERNYTVSELECLAIVESVDKFRIYLTGFVSADIIKQHQPTASPFNIDTNGLHTITRKGVIKIIIPETLQHTLMNKVHQEYNHPGISQMTRIITAQYYWKGISKSIEKFVRSCHTCQIIKRPKGKPYGALGQIPPPQQPFDLISIDTIAGVSKYGHSKTYLHVIVDHLTRYAWTFPSKSTSTLTYIQTLKTVLQQGSPKRLLSDRAPAFTSEKFRKFLITHGIQPLLTTSNNPQANGLIERLNVTITGKLRLAYLENPKASWTQLVKRVTQTYNNTPHSVTSFPPTYLMFNVIPPDLRTHLDPYPEINIAREIANSRTQNKHKKDKEIFDKQHRTPHFEVNDLVLVKNYRHPDTGKLAPYFTGPYKIIEIISPNVVRIDRPNQPLNRDSDTIHVNKLKYYTENVLYITPPQTRFAQNPQRLSQDVYFSEFNHLTPDIFETQLVRIIPPTSSQPFLHLNPMAEISWVPKEEERSIRRSRRLQGLTPDNAATMNNRSEATTQVSPLFCQNVVRNPSMFSGEISEDPQAWLKGYERVARHNHWDDSLSLANVYFYLHGTAQRWYENNEENIPSWEIFKDQLGSVFGKKDNLRRQAEQKLKVRAQTRGETTEFYIQDVLRLCREVDAQMPEEERLSHLMKGVAEEVYRYLLPRDIATTDQFIAECRRVVALQGRRVTASKFERLPNVTSLGDLGDVTDLQSLIRQIVREEVQRALAPPREEPRISSLEEIVKEEVDKVLAPMSGINTFPMESAARSAPRNYRKNTWYAPKVEASGSRVETRKFPWSQCYKTSQPVSSAFTIGKLRAAPSNGGEAAAQPIIPPLSTVVKMTNNYIDIKVEGDTIRALVDSGASYSVISERFRVELKKTMFAETDVVLKVADDKVVKSKGRCTLKLEVNGHPENFEFVVLENCSHDVILGWDFFKATNAVIDCGLGELQLDDLPDLDAEGRDDGVYAIQDFVIPGRSSQRISVVNRSLVGIVNMEVTCSKELFIRKDVIFPSSLIEFEEGIGKIWITNGGLQPQMIPKGMNLGRMCDIETEHVCLLSVEPESFSRERREDDHSDYLLSLINPDLPKKKKEDLMGLLLSFKGVFLPTMKNANKIQNRVKHRIHTGDHPPIKQRPYRVSKREREIMQKEVDTMLERKVIQPSESPWSAPVVLVKKKDGTWRFCVDFRRLNHITKKDVYPLPRIDDVLDHLSSARYYSTMDLKTGYWQVEVDERDREKTAFVTPDGLYEFMVMPFGLCNAPATFERMMDNVLMGLKWNICLCYLDDIVVYSDTFEEHLERLSKVLSCLQQAGLTINPDKCLFGSTRIKILGHVVDKDGIQPDSEKVEAIKKFPVPKSVCDIQSYLGLCSYYRRFIKNFSKIAAPLQILLKKDQKFIWTQEQKDSFESLKKALMQKPVLGHFKESAITKLHTDASSYGLGAVLVQIQENQENPIAYASRTLSKAEKNYSTTERECLAVIWAIGKFRPYLYGRPFEVVSDHHSLCWLAGLKDPSGRLARWALKLQDFDATITYKSGVKHKDADCLSRYPLPESPALTSLTLVREQQNLDPDITKISNALNQGEGGERFEMKNGLLYKRNFDPLGRRLLLVIPKCMRPDILKEFHDVPTAGHLGFARTYDRIRKRYFWPGLYNSVRRYVAHCKECQRRKGENKLPAGKLIPIKPPSFPFQKIGMDLLGRFPLSDKGNLWIIVCTDYLTKYAIAKALPSGTAAEIATFILEEVILKHGAPREIITDRGRAFMSQMVKEVTSRCKISHLFTTAYHPQTNGLTERLNKTLGDMLSMYVDAEQRDWDSVLPYVIFAYNTAQQGSTRFSPFFLVHGREAETLLDVLLPYEDETSDHDFGDQMVTKAEEARQLARIHILRAQENNKYHYDQVHRSVEYRVGDLVWVFTPVRKTGLSEKLLKKYFGPYKITRKVSEVNYEVEALEQSSRRRRRSQKDVVHVLRMKPYRDPGQQL
ncbi:hypothetical protein LAZ67_22002076, partial [Cordylochernes scorpioides]